MFDVLVTGPESDVRTVVRMANELQPRYLFHERHASPAVVMRYSRAPVADLVTASRTLGIRVCIDQSEGICGYAGIPRPLYLITTGFLGLLYWRALELNPLLIWEDFKVKEDTPGCLCARRDRLCEYAIALETPTFCRGCLQFFRCLGTEAEVLILQSLLRQIWFSKPLVTR